MRSRQDFPRGIDWDRARDVIDRLAGKNAAHGEYKRQMREGRVYGSVHLDELRDRGEDNLVRAIIRQIGKEAERLGLTQEVMVNIRERTKEGHTRQGYDKWGCLSVGQKADFVKAEFGKSNRQVRKAYKFDDRATAEHGETYTQMLAGFMRPERPPPNAPGLGHEDEDEDDDDEPDDE